MNQEVVISPEIIEYLGENYKHFDFKSSGALLLQKLQDDFVCLDKERKLDDYIEEKAFEYGDDLIFQLWTEFVFNNLKN